MVFVTAKLAYGSAYSKFLGQKFFREAFCNALIISGMCIDESVYFS